ncbi:uncharacterized protein LOC126744000 [Anthonomus grandis grandis]|uniref:uncharacterized protein LOC126744000 n=1 Tax=Anthonomus grandis grandis TaxID=2921223 RepID=UPI002165CC03|nr:uncharacterized protein LOC126744000 [Anthonomus grandis grandis]
MASTSGVQQQSQQQQFQQQFKCKECGLALNSAESLEVHKQYHEGNLMQQWALKEEKNNNMTKQQSAGTKREFTTNIPLNSPDIQKKSPEYNRTTPEGLFGHPPTPQSYQSASSPYNENSSAFSPNFQNYSNIAKSGDSSPASQQQQNHYQQQNFSPFPEQQQQHFFNLDHNNLYTYEVQPNKPAIPGQNFRYQPYSRMQYYEASKSQGPTSPAYPPQPTPSPSPKQCDKCGYVCESAAQLIEHNNLTHSQNYPQSNHFIFDQQPPHLKEDDASQSEILDLDSQKVVHPEWTNQKEGDKLKIESGIPHSVSAMLNPWSTSNQPQQNTAMFLNEHGMYLSPSSEQKLFHNISEANKVYPGDQKIFTQLENQNFLSNGVSSSNSEIVQQGYRPFEHLPTAPSSVVTSTQVPQVPTVVTSGTPNPKSSNWKSNEARRPKTYNCTACNKWFTSSGHLKRHYNTTLHKNAVKSSGQPDPASLPISAHHHPTRDSAQSKDDRGTNSNSPRDDSRGEDSNGMTAQYDNRIGPMPGLLQHPPNGPMGAGSSLPGTGSQLMQNTASFSTLPMGSPPNGEAGLSSPDSRGLLSTTTYNTMMPHHPNHHMVTPMEAATQFQMYPNGYAPHVTQATDTITSNLNTTGEAQNQYVVQQETQPLPSFAQISAHKFNTAGYANVGGLGTVTVPTSLTFFNTDVFDLTDMSRNIVFREDNVGYNMGIITQQEQQSNDIGQVSQQSLSPTSSNNNNEVNFAELSDSSNISYLSPGSSQTLSQSLTVSTESQSDSNKENEDINTSTGSPSISSTVSNEDLSKTTCYHCNKVFNRPCYLTQHNRTCHNGEKPFKCSRCGKRFATDETYKVHVEKHAGNKPHKCLRCPKMFNHKTDLRRHVCCHTGKKPFACEICGKGFIRKDHMVKHKETHYRKKQRNKVKQVYRKS